jgi:hypothetical protein
MSWEHTESLGIKPHHVQTKRIQDTEIKGKLVLLLLFWVEAE